MHVGVDVWFMFVHYGGHEYLTHKQGVERDATGISVQPKPDLNQNFQGLFEP